MTPTNDESSLTTASQNKTMSLSGDETWQTIVDSLTDELVSDDVPDDVIRMAEHLLSGYPLGQAAKRVGVSAKTARRWITMYPTLALVLSDGRKLLSKWRMAKLEQQFLQAIEKSSEVLNLELDGKNPKTNINANSKILTVVAAQSRYIIGLFAGQKVDIQITHEVGETALKARQDALDYLADQLRLQRDNSGLEPIEAVFRVEDSKIDNSGPLLDQDGKPHYGEFGEIDFDDSGAALCSLCGGRYKSLAKHILTLHGMGATDYETLFILEEGSLKESEKKQRES